MAAKHSETGGRAVQRDLTEHHARLVSLDFIQMLAGEVASVAPDKPYWRYGPVTSRERAAVIALGYDGTCVRMCEEGWKQVMVGALTIYDSEGEPLEALHVANALEDGKATFPSRMDRDVSTLKSRYPDALWVGMGISDEATDPRAEPGKRCGQLIPDFWHTAGYFGNNLDCMDHAAAVRKKLPIGSGIKEAVCKTIIKARLSGGGMRW